MDENLCGRGGSPDPPPDGSAPSPAAAPPVSLEAPVARGQELQAAAALRPEGPLRTTPWREQAPNRTGSLVSQPEGPRRQPARGAPPAGQRRNRHFLLLLTFFTPELTALPPPAPRRALSVPGLCSERPGRRHLRAARSSAPGGKRDRRDGGKAPRPAGQHGRCRRPEPLPPVERRGGRSCQGPGESLPGGGFAGPGAHQGLHGQAPSPLLRGRAGARRDPGSGEGRRRGYREGGKSEEFRSESRPRPLPRPHLPRSPPCCRATLPGPPPPPTAALPCPARPRVRAGMRCRGGPRPPYPAGREATPRRGPWQPGCPARPQPGTAGRESGGGAPGAAGLGRPLPGQHGVRGRCEPVSMRLPGTNANTAVAPAGTARAAAHAAHTMAWERSGWGNRRGRGETNWKSPPAPAPRTLFCHELGKPRACQASVPETEPRGERRLFLSLTPWPALALPPEACFSSSLFIKGHVFLLSKTVQTTFKISSGCGQGERLESRGTARQDSPPVFLLQNEPSTAKAAPVPGRCGAHNGTVFVETWASRKNLCALFQEYPPSHLFPRISTATPACKSKTRLEAGKSDWHYCCVYPEPGAPGFGQPGFSRYFKSFSAPLHLCRLAFPATVGGWQRQVRPAANTGTRRQKQAGWVKLQLETLKRNWAAALPGFFYLAALVTATQVLLNGHPLPKLFHPFSFELIFLHTLPIRK